MHILKKRCPKEHCFSDGDYNYDFGNDLYVLR